MRSIGLRSRWNRLCAELGAVAGGSDALLEALAARYSEPHRRYHTLEHISEVLGHVDRLVAAGEPVADACAVELAAWFHDAVYGPTAGDNEARSAQLAIEMLGEAGVEPERLGRVSDLVLATEHHIPGDADSAVLVDADLAVLGSDRERYLEYAAAIRAEYAHLDDDAYRRGRAEVLRGLLDRPLLYHTRTMRESRAERAARNIDAELRALTSAPGVRVDAALRRAIA